MAGIKSNGTNPWDIKVYENNFYPRVIKQGALGLGEAYMDKWWDCDSLDIFFEKILRANVDSKVRIPISYLMKAALSKIINFQTKKLSTKVAKHHYDLYNDLFSAMLDNYMQYSCGYWKNATTLHEAQQEKLELICQKLQLKPGIRLLDIGCGWGGLAKYAAERYDVQVVGVTSSKEQAQFAHFQMMDCFYYIPLV